MIAQLDESTIRELELRIGIEMNQGHFPMTIESLNLGYFPVTIEVLNGTIFLLISWTLDSGLVGLITTSWESHFRAAFSDFIIFLDLSTHSCTING